jgi:Rod binding domain-containing protein
MLGPLSSAGSSNQILPAALAARNASGANAAKVKEEFAALFYKEMLKQAFKAPDLSMGDEESGQSGFSAINTDLMIERLASELAKKGSFSLPGWKGPK